MELLHPVFTISVIILIAFSILEGYGQDYKNYRAVWFVIIALIIFSGFRKLAGADYGSYLNMYAFYGLKTNFSQILSEALFKDDGLEVEWLFVFFNNLFFGTGMPFYIFTFFLSIIAIVPKFIVFEKNSVYPALSWLLYMFPTYFSGDSGQVRQAVAMGIVLFSFEFIKSRKLLFYLIALYIAIGFHKSSVIFLPAYWLATIPVSKRTMLLAIGLCVVLSPFQVYDYISLLTSIAPEEIYSGFSNYSELEGSSGGIKFTDLLCVMYTFFIITFDKEACAKIPYYEYMRNLAVTGICMYLIFRNSPIFSSRLTAIYFVFAALVLPNIVASVNNLALRKYLYTILLIFVVFYYFVYANMQATKANFNDAYQNFLWN